MLLLISIVHTLVLKKNEKSFKHFYPLSIQKVSFSNVYNFFKNINVNKLIGYDLAPPKLVIIVADQVVQPVTSVINSAFVKSVNKNEIDKHTLSTVEHNSKCCHCTLLKVFPRDVTIYLLLLCIF